jgi:hypothetical protein
MDLALSRTSLAQIVPIFWFQASCWLALGFRAHRHPLVSKKASTSDRSSLVLLLGTVEMTEQGRVSERASSGRYDTP